MDFQPNTTAAPSQAQTLLGGLAQGFGAGVNSHLDRMLQLRAMQQYREQMLGAKSPLWQSQTDLNNVKTDNYDENAENARKLKEAQAELARRKAADVGSHPQKGHDPKSIANAQAAAHKQAVAQAGLDPKGDILSQVTANPDKAAAYNTAYQNYMQGATGKPASPVFDVGQTPGKWWGLNTQVKIHPGSEGLLTSAPVSAPAPAAGAGKTAADF